MPEAVHLCCSWHRSLNFKFFFLYFNKNSKTTALYNKIANLPYIDKKENFEEDYQLIISDQSLTNSEKEYLADYYNIKEKWSKCYTKKHFSCGIFTIQRVESVHAIQKNHLNRKSDLQQILEFIKNHDYGVSLKNIEEKDTFLSRTKSKHLEDIELIKFWREKLSNYLLDKIKYQLEKSLNYKVNELEEFKWYKKPLIIF